MPKKEEEKKKAKITISIDRDVLERIDRVAKSAKLTRSNMIQNLLEISLSLAGPLETFRILSVGAMVRDNLPKFTKYFRKAILEAEQPLKDKIEE